MGIHAHWNIFGRLGVGRSTVSENYLVTADKTHYQQLNRALLLIIRSFKVFKA